MADRVKAEPVWEADGGPEPGRVRVKLEPVEEGASEPLGAGVLQPSDLVFTEHVWIKVEAEFAAPCERVEASREKDTADPGWSATGREVKRESQVCIKAECVNETASSCGSETATQPKEESQAKFGDGTLYDATHMTEVPTVNINELRNLNTEEFTTKLNNESHYRHPSESNSSIINLRDSEEESETAEFESRDQHLQSCGSQSMIFNLDLKNENVDSNEYNSNQSFDEKTVNGPQATRTVKNNSRIFRNVCLICNVKFNSKSDHINHDIKMHNSNIKYYACSICDHKTTGSYSLKRHTRTHSNLKLKRPLSEFKTAPSCSLIKHANNHTPANDRNVNVDRPHTCTTCGNKYLTSSNLKRHIRTHTQERTHICMICKKGFLENCILKRHMKSHDQEKPHLCIVCKMRFSNFSSWKRHMHVHKIFTQNS